MITVLAYIMLIVFMFMIIKKKMTPLSALIIVPLVFGCLAAVLNLYGVPTADDPNVFIQDPTLWQRLAALGDFVLNGVKTTATTGIMLLFAILYFSIMLDAGTFDPITTAMIRFAKGDPVKILMATAIVSVAVSLNGDGTTTTLIVVTAFLPLYKKLHLKVMNLGVLLILMNTIMNLLPWGGPTARAISVLGLNEQTVLRSVAPGMILSIIYVLILAYFLGKKERQRVGVQSLTRDEMAALTQASSDEEEALKRPQYFWFNLIMTILLVVLLILGCFPSLFIFFIGTVLALMVNYHELKLQKQLIGKNAGAAVQVVILVFAAGAFMGLFTQTGMATALANSLTQIIPSSCGQAWGLITALLSAPGTFFLSNDAFYYGVVPVLAKTGQEYGFTALEIGTASLMGQAFHLLSPLVAFIYLLLNMTGLDMVEWQKESGKWAIGIFIIFIATAGLLNIVPLIK